jgi:hypothetical protein
MEKITMEQFAELLKTQYGFLAAKMDANRQMEAEREADKAEMRAHHERMMTKLDAWLGKMEACREAMEVCQEVTRLSGEEGTNSRGDRDRGTARRSP